MIITGIYKLTSPSGKIYIGQSRNINKRILDYKNIKCKSQRKLYNSLIKYGWEGHKFEIINELPKDVTNYHLDILEQLYINCYLDTNTELLNVKLASVRSLYPEEIILQKKPLKKIKIVKELDTTNPMYNKKHSVETRLLQSQIMKSKNRVISEETRKVLNKAVCKPCYRYDLKNNFIDEFSSIAEAGRQLNFNRQVISSHMNGYRPTAYGFVFKYIKT